MAHDTMTVNSAPDDTQAQSPLYWYSPAFHSRIDQLSLGAGAASTWTVPAGTWDSVVITFTAGKLYYSRTTLPAVVPAGTLADGTGAAEVLNGQSRRVKAGLQISFINATACVVSFELASNGRREP